jgi:DNA-binding XRE family transcriptional regulator
MHSQYIRDQYKAILQTAKDHRVQFCTQDEMARFLEVSSSTIKRFEAGQVIRFDLLEQYLAMCSPLTLIFDITIKPTND